MPGQDATLTNLEFYAQLYRDRDLQRNKTLDKKEQSKTKGYRNCKRCKEKRSISKEILESELGRLPRGPVPPTGSRPSQSEVARQWEHHPLIHIHHHVQIMEASSAGGSRTALAKCRGADGGRERGVEQQPSS